MHQSQHILQSFGMGMFGRSSGNEYAFGNNGQRNENELFEGAFSAEFWMYDSRLGRRWETDPLAYSFQSPYVCFNNNPIYYSDPSGLEGDPPVKKGESINLDNGQTYTPSVDEIDVTACITCDSQVNSKSITAASTGNVQPTPSVKPTQNQNMGNYYEGMWQISYNSNLQSVNNFNILNQSQTKYLGEPNLAGYMQQAQDLAYNGGASVGWKGVGLNTGGDISIGYKDPNVTVNMYDASVVSVGGKGASFSTSGIEIGPLKASNESSIYTTGPNIVHNQTGQVTGTVQANFIIQKLQASLFIGAFSSKVTAVRSFSATNGGVNTQTLGIYKSAGFSAGIQTQGGFSAGVDIKLK